MAVDYSTLIGQLLGGGIDLYNVFGHGGTTDMGVAKDAAARADPFATQRPQYQTMLQGLLTDPNSFKTDPGYQFALGQGQDAIKGAGNAIYGGTRAGAIYPELAKFTEGYASQSYDKRIDELMRLAGAESGSPGLAGQLYARGGEQRDQDLGNGIGSLLSGLLGGPSLGGLLSGNEGGIVGLISRLLNPNSSGGLPNVSGTNTIGTGSGTSTIGGGGTPGGGYDFSGGGDPYGFGDPGGLNDFITDPWADLGFGT